VSIPRVGRRKDVSRRILNGPRLLLDACLLDLFRINRGKLFRRKGQLKRVLDTFEYEGGSRNAKEYLPSLFEVEGFNDCLGKVYRVLLSDAGFDCQGQSILPEIYLNARLLSLTLGTPFVSDSAETFFSVVSIL
jgi:hypothetical protein